MYLAEIGKLIMFHHKTGLLPDIFQNNLETKEIEIKPRLKNYSNLNLILTCNIYLFVFCNLQCNHAIVPAYGWFLARILFLSSPSLLAVLHKCLEINLS